MLDYYSRGAAEYERIYDKPERQADLAQLQTLIAGEAAGHRVLELACGTGWWTQVLASCAEFVLATDTTPEVLDIAREKPLVADKVLFAQLDAYDVPALTGQFSAVFAGFWWSHVPRQQLGSFLAGLSRGVGPDVKLLFVDNRYVEGSSTPVVRPDERGNTYQLRKLDDGSEHGVLKNFPDESELRMTLAPFASQLRVWELPHYWMTACTTRTPA